MALSAKREDYPENEKIFALGVGIWGFMLGCIMRNGIARGRQAMQETGVLRPLRAHSLFQSDDLDEARERVAAVFCPHRLDTIGRGARLAARHHHLRGDRISLNYIEYGAKTLISPGMLEKFYLMQIPLSGGAAIANGSDRYVTGRGQAAVLNPHEPTSMIWGEGTAQVLIQIDRRAVSEHVSGLLGHGTERPVTFRGALDLTRGAGAMLRQMAMFLVAEADAGRAPFGVGQMRRQVEAMLIGGLLEAHQHDFRDRLGRAMAAPRPRHLRLAEGYIEAHLDQPLTVEEIAAVAGISVRGLQMAFRQHRGTTPLAWWRRARLERAHEDLLAGRGSVTDVALKWGFSHFGRFAQDYAARFGIRPRDSLRAGRGVGYSD